MKNVSVPVGYLPNVIRQALQFLHIEANIVALRVTETIPALQVDAGSIEPILSVDLKKNNIGVSFHSDSLENPVQPGVCFIHSVNRTSATLFLHPSDVASVFPPTKQK